MGLINDPENPTYRRLSAGLADATDGPPRGPDAGSIWGAAFRTENVVGSILSLEEGLDQGEIDHDFDPITDENLAGFEEYSDRFYDVYNAKQNAALKRQITREREDRDILARSGLAGFGAAMAAGTLDPTILIPVGGTIKKGESLLRVGQKMLYAGAAGAAVSEAALHASQQTRTAEESGLAIASGAVLGGLLGTGAVAGFRGVTGKPIAGFDPDELARFEREMVHDPDGDLNDIDPDLIGALSEQLRTTGRIPDDAIETEATALAAMMQTLARQEGVSSNDLMATYGPRIEAGPPAQRGSETLSQATKEGFEGTDGGEAREWLAAKAKGLDMSPEGIKARAAEQGFDTETVLYHGTGFEVEALKSSRRGELGSGVYLTPDAELANTFAGGFGGKSNVLPVHVRGQILNADDLAPYRTQAQEQVRAQGEASGIIEVKRAVDARERQLLREAGYSGIEQKRRGGVSEIVIFDPSNIRSVHAAFDPDNTGSANLLAQAQRGQFDANRGVISLFETADRSTFMHESAHWYLDTLIKMEGTGSQGFVSRQLDDIFSWAGFDRGVRLYDDSGKMTEEFVELQEKFAETFEVYLQTGKAPTKQLKTVFDRFREWLTAIYKSVDNRLRANLTPEIQQVFDRMLALEPGAVERFDTQAMRNPQSVGAAAVAEPTLDDYALAPSAKTADVSAALRLNPLLRMATADSPVVREISAQLMENGMYLKRNLEGRASPVSVEQAMTEYRGWHAKAATAAEKAYRASRRDKNSPNLTSSAFYERVALAMRRGDQDANPHVEAAAKAYREAVEKVKDRAVSAGLLPEDVKVTTADSYFHRMWNRNALNRRSADFKAMTRAWLGETFDGMIARAKRLRFELMRLAAEPDNADKKFLDQVDELEAILRAEGSLADFAKTVADDIFDALMGHDTRLVDTGFSIVPNARGPLKERTFNIPDLFESQGVKVEDFLVNDAQEVMNRYMRVMAADIELTRAFGSPDLAQPIAHIREDYRAMSDAAKTTKERKRLNDQMRNRVDDLNGVRDVIRGNYGENRVSGAGAVWARGAELVRAWNFMTMLGGMTVSALPDVGNKVMANGFLGLTRDLVGPLISDIKGVRGAAREAKELGIATEMALATRIASLADVGDMYGRGTQFERFVHGLSNRFSNWTLMRHWNDIMKTGDYIAATNRAIRVMERPARADKKAKAWLAQLGIGEADYLRIMTQIKEHGDKRHTMRLANVQKWTDEEAKRIWIGALGKNANIQTVTPGAGDKLLVMNGDLGKTLGQFKSFALAANQRIMIRGAQLGRMGDARFLSGVATFISLGMLVYVLKSYFSNRDTSDDPVTWVREGIDRSGIMPVFMEAFNTAEKVSGQSFVGESPASRFASRGRVDSLAGPTFGRMQNVSDVLANAFDGELKDRDLHSVRKILPFNNVFWLRKLFDEFEIQAVEALDAEETSLSDRRESMLAN